MSTLITGDYNVGDVISLLWFKRQLPKYATRFIELVVMLCADHGPCVSGERSCLPPTHPLPPFLCVPHRPLMQLPKQCWRMCSRAVC